MKLTRLSMWVLLFVSAVSLPITFAQDSNQWHLPEGATARLGRGAITRNVQYSPDGTLLAVSSSIGVWLYDADTHEEINLLTGHTAWVSCVAFSPDGRTLASGGRNTTIHLWDVETARHRTTLTGHTESVRTVAFSPDGKTLASGGQDRSIRLWEYRPNSPKQLSQGI